MGLLTFSMQFPVGFQIFLQYPFNCLLIEAAIQVFLKTFFKNTNRGSVKEPFKKSINFSREISLKTYFSVLNTFVKVLKLS